MAGKYTPITEPNGAREHEKTKPEDTDFRQQRLRAWQPMLIPNSVILGFFILGLLLTPLGFVMFEYSNRVVELQYRYDDLPCDNPGVLPCTKTISITAPKDMDGPIYFFYKLTNFYQNHRRFIKSLSEAQLQGDDTTDLDGCKLLESYKGKDLYPCGLIASSIFNDSFMALEYPDDDATKTPIPMTTWRENGIAWDSDKKVKYDEKYPGELDNLPNNLTRVGPFGPIPQLDNEHLMVWMRSAAWHKFKKLYAVIDSNISKGDKIDIIIQDQYDAQSYGGEKWIVLTTATWLGGANTFLGWAYISCGALAFIMVIVMGLKQAIMPRRLGDMSSVWNIERIRKVTEPGKYDE